MTRVEERFWSKVRKTETCWIWLGGKNSDGYGYFFVNGKDLRAHRVMLQLVGRPIPTGMQIDHLCRNRRCVNPDHLEVVTHRENALRGQGRGAKNARRTHCVKGHEFTSINTWYPAKRRPALRVCRVCRKLRQREWRAKNSHTKRRVSICCEANYEVHSTCPVGEPTLCATCNQCGRRCGTNEIEA